MAALLRALSLAALGLLLQGCTVFSPTPLWELVKAAGGLASENLQSQPGSATQTVVHQHNPSSELCIEFNPKVQLPDLLPALQIALQRHRIESRIFDSPIVGSKCQLWLRYSANMQWGRRWLSEELQPYLTDASLTLQNAHGEILASSRYEIGALGRSKWATTHDKLLASVTSLVDTLPSGPY